MASGDEPSDAQPQVQRAPEFPSSFPIAGSITDTDREESEGADSDVDETEIQVCAHACARACVCVRACIGEERVCVRVDVSFANAHMRAPRVLFVCVCVSYTCAALTQTYRHRPAYDFLWHLGAAQAANTDVQDAPMGSSNVRSRIIPNKAYF